MPSLADHALLAPAVAASLIGASCAGAPAPRRDTAAPATATVVPVAVPAPARWVESRGATTIGPAVAGGTLVLVGGRRAIVAADGAVQVEAAPAREALEEIVEVPSTSGSRLVARGAHEIVRLDDPLGAPVPLARSELPLTRIGAGPGVVAVWAGRSERPRFLDVATGKETPWRSLPAPPLRALGFLDEARGAGVFEAVGLEVTADGGATWRPVAESAPRDGLRAAGIRRRGASLRAYAYADGPDGAIDAERGLLGPFEPPFAPAGEPAVLRWIRATERDPLEAAATGGLELPAGLALVASHGLVARVDPRTGAVAEIVELARSRSASPCAAARAAGTAWIACALSQDFGRDLFDPFGVMRVALGGAKLAPDAPVLVRNGEAELRASPSGGAMLTGPCDGENGQACVRQPDGRWRTLSSDDDLADRAMGPLADGRVAFLRGLFDGDVASPADAADRGRGLHVAILGPDGKERALGPIGFAMSRGHARAQSPIEEDLDHALHFVIEDGEGPFAVMVPPSGEGAEVRRIPDAAIAKIHAGRGVAVGEGHVLVSLDEGSTWDEVPAPPAALEAASAAASAPDDPDTLALSEIGARIGPMLRLGWGPPDPAASQAPPAPPEGPLLPPPARGPDPRRRKLVCTTLGPSTAAPLTASTAEVKGLLAGKAGKGPAGTRRESSAWSLGAFDARALLEEEGPEGAGSSPATWTFRWYDPEEVGGRPRSATFAAPRGATWGTGLRFAAASGGHALFLVRTGGKSLAVRVEGQKPEIAEVPLDLGPAGQTTFGEGKGDPVVWVHGGVVVAWLPGERPRAVAELATSALLAAGEPTRAGVPLLLEAGDWSLTRVVPIAPLDPAAPDRAPRPLSLDGFAAAEPLGARLAALPVCAPAAKGTRFSLTPRWFEARVDGVDQVSIAASFRVRAAGAEACVEAVATTLAPDRSKAAPPGVTPAAFVRADLTGKRAEGGERGIAPGSVRRMKCELAAP